MRALQDSTAMRKAYQLGLKVVRLSRTLNEEYRTFELSRQILRSGTSIGANIAEAQGGISRADFSAKIGIANKEGLETKYWLNLLFDSDLLEEEEFMELLELCDEICRILFAILKKTRYSSNQLEEPPPVYGAIDWFASENQSSETRGRIAFAE